MSNYLSTTFSYYPANIAITEPLGEISLYDYLYAIKNPKPHILEVFKEIEKASLEGDLKKKADLKKKLYYFTPCCRTNGLGRSYESIVSFTNLLILDFDNLEKEFAVDLKEYIFNSYSCVIASFLSASKRGCKIIIRIPKCSSVDEFKSYFYGIASEMQYYKGFDSSSKNCILPNFLTYDPDLLYRLDATIWNKVGIQIDEFKEFDGEFEPLEDINPKDVVGIKLMIKRMLDKIEVEQQGHGNVVHTGLILGGFVGANYLSFEDAKEYVFDLMDNIEYLQKGLRGYQKTIIDMMKRGTLAPLKYER